MNLGVTHIAFDATRWSVSDPPWLAEGVRGYTALLGTDLWIVMVLAEPEGHGHMGAYLDSLIVAANAFSTKTRIIMVEPNEKMAGMCERRGFRPTLMELPDVAPVQEVVRVHVYD